MNQIWDMQRKTSVKTLRVCLVPVWNSSRIACPSQPSLVEEKQALIRHMQLDWLPASLVPALGNTQVHFVWLAALALAAHEHGVWLHTAYMLCLPCTLVGELTHDDHTKHTNATTQQW